MKILFLDFDGVLNTGSYQNQLRTHGNPDSDGFGELFDPEAVGNLKKILDAVPDVRVVVSSSWKLYGLDQMRLMWRERSLPGKLFDVTPDLPDDDLLAIDLSDITNLLRLESIEKGREISAWIKRYGGRNCRYVILDDVAEFSGDLSGHHVRTNPDIGLSREDALRAIAILK